MQEFTVNQACRLVGCTGNQLRYWDQIGLVKPSVQSTGGKPGVRRLYSFRDLVAIQVITGLLEGGMSLQRVREAFVYLRKKAGLDEHLASVRLLTDGRTIFGVDAHDGQILDALRNGQMAFLLTLGKVTADLDEKVAQLLPHREELALRLKRNASTSGQPGQEVVGLDGQSPSALLRPGRIGH